MCAARAELQIAQALIGIAFHAVTHHPPTPVADDAVSYPIAVRTYDGAVLLDGVVSLTFVAVDDHQPAIAVSCCVGNMTALRAEANAFDLFELFFECAINDNRLTSVD